MNHRTMSAAKHMVKGNVPGKYYTIEKCIGCSLCYEISPNNFWMNFEEGYDYVFKQPVTQEEEALCLKAMQSCPADAIRNDGPGFVK